MWRRDSRDIPCTIEPARQLPDGVSVYMFIPPIYMDAEFKCSFMRHSKTKDPTDWKMGCVGGALYNFSAKMVVARVFAFLHLADRRPERFSRVSGCRDDKRFTSPFVVPFSSPLSSQFTVCSRHVVICWVYLMASIFKKIFEVDKT